MEKMVLEVEVTEPGIHGVEPETQVPFGRRFGVHKSPTAPRSFREGLPRSLLFGALRHPRLRLKAPIPVEVSREQKLAVVSNPELDEFGSGDSLGDALQDFAKSLAELYLRLDEEKEKLGPGLQRVWTRLQDYIEPHQ